MAQTLSSHGPSNWFFLNLIQCAKECSEPNFMLLAVFCSPFPRNGQNVVLLWPKHGPHIILKIGFLLSLNDCGPHMVLRIGSLWIFINVPRDVPFQISHCWVYPVAPTPRNGKNMAILWPKHGPLNWLWLNLNQFAQGCFMPNLTLLGVSCRLLS